MKFKLLKDTYDGMKAGAILEKGRENCPEWYEYRDSSKTIIVDDSIVENTTEWFEEVKEGEYEGYGKRVRSWKEITDEIDGYYNTGSSETYRFVNGYPCDPYRNVNVSATKNIAKSQLAQSQLSQLLVQYWGDWRPDWNNAKQKKYTLAIESGGIYKDIYFKTPHFLCFPTDQMRDDFLEDHRELIKEYFLQYQW